MIKFYFCPCFVTLTFFWQCPGCLTSYLNDGSKILSRYTRSSPSQFAVSCWWLSLPLIVCLSLSNVEFWILFCFVLFFVLLHFYILQTSWTAIQSPFTHSNLPILTQIFLLHTPISLIHMFQSPFYILQSPNFLYLPYNLSFKHFNLTFDTIINLNFTYSNPPFKSPIALFIIINQISLLHPPISILMYCTVYNIHTSNSFHDVHTGLQGASAQSIWSLHDRACPLTASY